jgi:hypothetical protein
MISSAEDAWMCALSGSKERVLRDDTSMTPHTVFLGSSRGHSWGSEIVRIGMVASPAAAGEDVLAKKSDRDVKTELGAPVNLGNG